MSYKYTTNLSLKIGKGKKERVKKKSIDLWHACPQITKYYY
jgi:hypothetical protein